MRHPQRCAPPGSHLHAARAEWLPVEYGWLNEPYLGEQREFILGVTSTAIHIDHLVSLSDAWQKGAQQWTSATRVNFANDPLNLWAVDGGQNNSKGDGDAATWLPPNRAARCDLVSAQTGVKHTYGLWVTQAEQDAIRRVVTESCPGRVLPTRHDVPPLGQ
ncbi:HNH endonuclease family protein [Ornithinimicrobium sp. Y1694]|uniref:HNH endonuclease family protein n=1 Tax=Ornithinimicrobium sp. Y1694 TaxID=3418590 RepID=UPI003CE7EE10